MVGLSVDLLGGLSDDIGIANGQVIKYNPYRNPTGDALARKLRTNRHPANPGAVNRFVKVNH